GPGFRRERCEGAGRSPTPWVIVDASPGSPFSPRSEEASMASGTLATTLLEAARELRPRILAQREQIETGRRLPEELTQELARAGFFRASLPAVYGGLELDLLEALAVVVEAAGADGAG